MHAMVRRKIYKETPPLEEAVHIALAELLRIAIKPGWIWWHTPNGGERPSFINSKGKRISIEGAQLKKMGARSGVSDFLLIAPNGAQLHALELKRKHIKPTKEQRDFLRSVIDAGGRGAWCDSFEDAVAFLEYWEAIKEVHL